jgi:glycosyltransferase involved in cell wall biosynthesis
MKIAYIAETYLTNRSAQSIHVVKICDAFSKKNKLTLLLPKNDIKFTKIKKEFMLTSKNKFLIKPLLNKKISNFFHRLYFGFKVSKFLLKNDQDLIITRSFICSFFLSTRRIKHIFEIHSELKGLTKLLMINLNFINSIYVKKIIFISKALKNKFKILNKSKSIVLHDAVDMDNFALIKINKNKTIKNLAYVGSFHKGKGVELVCELARRFKNLNFNIFGDSLGRHYPKLSNLKFHGYIKYNQVPKKLYSSDILLLPSAKIQFGRSNSVNISNYNSPLKMFDYLASGKIIVASKLDGICEVLKHKYNSIITGGFEINDWENSINSILKNNYDLNLIRQNSIKTAKNYTWEKRVKIITNLKYN